MRHITREKLKEVLNYDPLTGDFTWKAKLNNKCVIGAKAGNWSQGYWSIGLFNKEYQAHRLAWLYVYGTLPPRIDHKDGDGTHNWIDNLRECTQTQNNGNQKLSIANTSGFKGVTWDKARQKWLAGIKIYGKRKNLGRFDTAEEAHEVYQLAADMLFGEFANYGKHKPSVRTTTT